MNRVYVLVEGPIDAAFLRRILPPELVNGAELVDAGGSAGIPSLARSILVRRKTPVAVLMDSGSVDPGAIEVQQQSTEDLIRAADASVPVKVVLAVPEVEAWFFATPELVERIVGQKFPSEWLPLARMAPKAALRQFAENHHKQWDTQQAINSLDADDIERIRAIPAVAELSAFLQEMQAPSQPLQRHR